MCESEAGLRRLMEELAEQIIFKGIEPKQESLWWTSTFAEETEGPHGS